MQKTDLQSLDLKQLQDLKAINDHYLSNCLPIAQNKKISISIHSVISVPYNETEERLTNKIVLFEATDLIPPEFKKAFEDYTTRLIAENWLIDGEIENKQKSRL